MRRAGTPPVVGAGAFHEPPAAPGPPAVMNGHRSAKAGARDIIGPGWGANIAGGGGGGRRGSGRGLAQWGTACVGVSRPAARSRRAWPITHTVGTPLTLDATRSTTLPQRGVRGPAIGPSKSGPFVEEGTRSVAWVTLLFRGVRCLFRSGAWGACSTQGGSKRGGGGGSVPGRQFCKKTACSSNVQPGLVAIGGWRLATGGWWRLAVVGGW